MKLLSVLVKNSDGSRLMRLYQEWPVDGEPVDVKLADGSTRKSWPLTWAELEKELQNLHVKAGAEDGKLSDKEIAAVKAETVDNDKKPWVTSECVTWPSIQNVFRDAWVLANEKPWKPEEHQEGMDFFCLLRANTLAVKVEGLSKMLKELGQQAAIDMMWKIYAAWPSPMGEEQECARLNRKTGKPETKKTWPLPFEGEKSVTSVLTECGWSEFLIAALKTQLMDKKDQSGVHENCKDEEVCWPDLQQAFRSGVSEDSWDEALSEEWPPLAPFVTLRLKIPQDKIKETLEGEWRMYCKPEEGEAFSYGLIIESVDPEAATFSGRARTEGKYVCENGKIEYNPTNGRTRITYDEVWPNGQRDHLAARVKKYYVYDNDAAHEGGNAPAAPAPAATADEV